MATTAISKRYDVTESKKTRLNALTLKVINAQYKVNQLTAVVSALTGKLSNFNTMLAIAGTNRQQALNDKNSVDQLVQSVLDLENNSNIALREICAAGDKANALAASIKDVITKLIYTAEMINKLAAVVIRRKALNPLISDDLITQLTQAGKDANKAVALTLVAVQATYAAQASGVESEAATALGYRQSVTLFEALTGVQVAMDANRENIISFSFSNNQVPESAMTLDAFKNSLLGQLTSTYEIAKQIYDRDYKAVVRTTAQLNSAKSHLAKAQVKLKSLQSGLAAANAAALA